MNKFIAFLLLCTIFVGCGQPIPDEKPKAPVDKNIHSTKTAKHINIPGTKVFIIPPPGFEPASSFLGLQKDQNTAVQVYDLDGGNFYSNAATFSRNEFEKKGAKVFDYQEFKVNDYPAKYIFMQGDPSAKAISIVFGDSTFSIMLMFIYPANDNETGEEIKAAIKTLYYDKNLKVDPFASAPFILDDSKSKFKFDKTAGGLFLYTLHGDEKQSHDEPGITVMTLPKDASMTTGDISEMCVTKLQQYGLLQEKRTNRIIKTANGYAGYETEIVGSMDGKKCLIYQLIVAVNEKAVLMQAIIPSGFERNLEEVKKLAYEIKLK